jgi:hypothetical protein
MAKTRYSNSETVYTRYKTPRLNKRNTIKCHTHLITAFISRWSDTIGVEASHIIPPPRRIIIIITNLRPIDQLTVRLVVIRLLVAVDNSFASPLFTAALSACLNAVRNTATENSGFIAAAKTSVAAFRGGGWVINESVAEASRFWWRVA